MKGLVGALAFLAIVAAVAIAAGLPSAGPGADRTGPSGHEQVSLPAISALSTFDGVDAGTFAQLTGQIVRWEEEIAVGAAKGSALAMPSRAFAEAPLVETHYSPSEALDDVDAELINQAGVSIDFYGYILTDAKVEEALLNASQRGVAVKIILDPKERKSLDRLGELASTVRYCRDTAPCHLKSYAVDGAVLRTGSANFTRSGETAQPNDLIVIRDAALAQRFEARYANLWNAASPIGGETSPRSLFTPSSPFSGWARRWGW